ncbi:MAG: hypothetical protein LBK50_00135 [Candidatus Nomurabacteria bacterium]|jgi:hypothetical protein|nr:hypothetical protein [Candidatus Nomurabacteria bacterium]
MKVRILQHIYEGRIAGYRKAHNLLEFDIYDGEPKKYIKYAEATRSYAFEKDNWRSVKLSFPYENIDEDLLLREIESLINNGKAYIRGNDEKFNGPELASTFSVIIDSSKHPSGNFDKLSDGVNDYWIPKKSALGEKILSASGYSRLEKMSNSEIIDIVSSLTKNLDES